MLIGGIVVLLVIVGMFLQMLTASPRPEAEWQTDTDEEVSTTPAPADDETHVAVA